MQRRISRELWREPEPEGFVIRTVDGNQYFTTALEHFYGATGNAVHEDEEAHCLVIEAQMVPGLAATNRTYIPLSHISAVIEMSTIQWDRMRG